MKGTKIAVALAMTASLAGCTSSAWRAHYDRAERALQTPTEQSMALAEAELKKTIEVAWKDRVPEKDIVHVYSKLGNLLMDEKKYEEAPMYLIRTIQFNDVKKVGVEQNIKQLKQLVTAYEKSRDYEQAEQTQNVLVHLIEFEKSPMDPRYKPELAHQKELKVKLASFNRPIANVKPAPFDAAAIKESNNLLQGWH